MSARKEGNNMGIKQFLKKRIYGHLASSEDYAAYLRDLGMSVGENTVFVDPKNTAIDVTRPWMVKIGGNCTIAPGVTVMTHDYGLRVLKGVYGDVLGRVDKVEIGDNVYIGMHATVVAGVKIGNNVIVGANSLVSKDIPDNCVAAGNPARVICTLDAYFAKRKATFLQEAQKMAKMYYDTYKKIPPKEVFFEHFWLFTGGEDALIPEYEVMNRQTYGEEGIVEKRFREHEKVFASYEEFIQSCHLGEE